VLSSNERGNDFRETFDKVKPLRIHVFGAKDTLMDSPPLFNHIR